jgi:SAM-dependent MidA family methyltransferase
MTERPYDPEARRDTPLARKLKERIRREGPITVAEYMRACLEDAEHGYYRTRNAIGRAGDFVTAPEISQVFGELIGLWCAVVWQQMGSPATLNLIELGPGRGTMMRDMLRAAHSVPQFEAALRILLREPNPVLRAIQSETLKGAQRPVSHLDSDELPDGPCIFVGNEYLDCLPISQVQWVVTGSGEGWCGRHVGLDDAGRLQFVLGTSPYRRNDAALAALPLPRDGDILEDRRANGIVQGLAAAAGKAPVAALFIDYGHVATGYGDTLQAVRDHRPEHPLTSPGEADLTSHVDFAAFAGAIRRRSEAASPRLAIDGPTTQAEFLGRLGIMERASRLMAANPAKAAEIELGVARLMAVPGMGNRFKALSVRSAGLPPLPGL